jgi:hypothetical protein
MAIAQAHKGSLTVKSEQKQGSTFIIKLAIQRNQLGFVCHQSLRSRSRCFYVLI